MILEKVPEVQRLSPEEKWKLIDELWQELIPLEDHAPRPEIVALLDQRMEEFRRHPGLGSTWEEAKARLRAVRGA